MRTKILNLLAGIALATGMISASASSVSVATVPVGIITYTITSGSTTMLSLPLTNTETYSSTVNTVAANTISVSDAPAPFTTNLATAAAPYFVKFLTGNEAGRVVLISSNTTSVLTLDTTDHATGSPIPLNTTGFNVQSGDAFEIFPGDTLASIFGNGTVQHPVLVAGDVNPVTADSVTLFISASIPAASYFYSTTDKCWEQIGLPGNANNTIVYPYSAFAVNRRLTHADTTLIVSGRVTPVGAQTKIISNGTVFSSTHFATDVKLSQLKFGSNWVMNSSILKADTLSVWNPAANQFDTYYQVPDSTWRKFPDAVTNQSNVAISAGTVTAIAKREAVTGSATFLQTPLPYSLD